MSQADNKTTTPNASKKTHTQQTNNNNNRNLLSNCRLNSGNQERNQPKIKELEIDEVRLNKANDESIIETIERE